MENLKSYLKGKGNMKNDGDVNFNYSLVPGQENIVKVSFNDDGQKKSVLLETFSDAQFELIDRLKKKAEELRAAFNEAETLDLAE